MEECIHRLLNEGMQEGVSFEKQELSEILPLFRYRKLKNNEVLFSPGQKKTEIALILSGVVRHYLIDSRDREKTTDFLPNRGIYRYDFR